MNAQVFQTPGCSAPDSLRGDLPTPVRMRGIGLIELMIAITIGLVLIAGAMTVFINSRATYNTNQEVARLMENGSYALDELSRSLKLAGYWGRNNASTLVRARTGDTQFTEIFTTDAATDDCTAGWYAMVSRRVEGLNNTNVPYDSTCVPTARYLAGTDVLVVRHVEPDAVATGDLQADTVYIRSDPAGAELFVGTTEPGGFSAVAQNYRLRSEAIYVSSFNLTAGDGIPTLKRAALTVGPAIFIPGTPSADEILIPGIQDMQIQYGLDRSGDGSANQYVDADKVAATQWDNIVAVRVWLLVRSELTDGRYENTSSYRLPDGVYTPPTPPPGSEPDRFRRIVMSRTIELRN